MHRTRELASQGLEIPDARTTSKESLALLELICRFKEEGWRYPEWYGSVTVDAYRLEDSFFDVIWVNSRRASLITLLQSLVDLTLRTHLHSDLEHRLKEM